MRQLVVVTILTALVVACEAEDEETVGYSGPAHAPCRATFDYGDKDDHPEDYLYYEYDERGFLVRVYEDDENDGAMNSVYRYHYDGALLTFIGYDQGMDGAIDSSQEFSYDEDGRLIRIELPMDEERYAYYYDSEGRLIEDRWYWHTVPGEERWSAYKYYYDDQGLLDHRTSIFNAWENDEVDEVTYYEYDDQGKRIKYHSNPGAGGLSEDIYLYYYGENGLLERADFYQADNETPSSTWTYEYDADQNLVLVRDLFNEDWTSNFHYSYECWADQ